MKGMREVPTIFSVFRLHFVLSSLLFSPSSMMSRSRIRGIRISPERKEHSSFFLPFSFLPINTLIFLFFYFFQSNTSIKQALRGYMSRALFIIDVLTGKGEEMDVMLLALFKRFCYRLPEMNFRWFYSKILFLFKAVVIRKREEKE